MSMTPPFNQTRVTGATEFVVSANRCAIIALIPEATTSGTIAVRDAGVIGGGSTPIHTAAAGLTQSGKQFSDWGVKLQNGITLTLSNGADALTVVWAPYP